VPGDTVEEAETVYYKIFVIMENKKWNDVLLEWVNCLKLCKYINDVEELRNGEFFMNLQKLM
jgi:ATP-dependent RNA circularization protein (DNA/RNA ligase family)